MNNTNKNTPAAATSLGQAIVPIDFDQADYDEPAVFAASIRAQLQASKTRCLQAHFQNGDIYQFDCATAAGRDDLALLLEQLEGSDDRFYLVALAQPMMEDEIPNVFGEIEADVRRAQTEPGYKTKFAGVQEMQVALACGCARELIDLRYHIHRREEIVAVVNEILAVPVKDYPHAAKIRAAAVLVLRTIDRIIASSTENAAA